MRYFTSALCAVAAFSAAVFAQENPIIKPDATEPVVAGSPYIIKWKPTTEGTITLTLRQGESTNLDDVYVIADGAPNSGTYEWTPKSSLPAGKDYAIMITSAKGDKNYTPLIEIESDAAPEKEDDKDDEEEDKDEKPKSTTEDAEPSKTAAPSGRITPISNSTKFSNSTKSKTSTKARKPTPIPTTAEPEPSATESAEPSGSAAPDSGAMAVVRSPIALIACLAAGFFFLN